ncbi:MAG: hypothetical protein AABX52_00890 [Nanoarchaeota archaeon]
MAMFDFLKKKSAQEPNLSFPPAPAPTETPTEYVTSMQQQGLSNNQIIQILQRQGYNQTQVYDALNQATLKSTITGATPISAEEIQTPIIPQPAEAPQQRTLPAGDSHTASFEEIAESIVDEKWKELQKKIDKDREWRDQTEIRITKIEQQITDLRTELDNLHRAIISKIGDYDKSLLSVGTEIRAMEKVFQKILPELTDNVSELSRITKAIKSKK